jgi:hypothetical protein
MFAHAIKSVVGSVVATVIFAYDCIGVTLAIFFTLALMMLIIQFALERWMIHEDACCMNQFFYTKIQKALCAISSNCHSVLFLQEKTHVCKTSHSCMYDFHKHGVKSNKMNRQDTGALIPDDVLMYRASFRESDFMVRNQAARELFPSKYMCSGIIEDDEPATRRHSC